MRIKIALLGCSAAFVLTAGLAGTASADGAAPSPKPGRPGAPVVCPPANNPSDQPGRCAPTPAPAKPGQPTYTG